MSRITELFLNKPGKVLNVYCTAGYPELTSTLEVMKALEESGVDLIELGMPYSDPLADGPVIQQSSSVSLKNGMTLPVLFDQLKQGRSSIQIPVILMGYMNPVLQFGFESFCRSAAEAGVDGLILPDLPPYEYESIYGPVIKKYGLDFIFLVTPETDEARIRYLDGLSSGFLYAVSSSSTTGSSTGHSDVETYLRRLQSLSLKNPVLVGFGISDKQSFERVCAYANGGIIGTAFIRALGQGAPVREATEAFIRSIRS